jgi:hypothetical protein
MRITLVHNHFDQAHLDKVIEEMKTLGAPIIRAFYDEFNDEYVALEGCHRIRAAKELGLIPEVEVLDFSELEEMVLSQATDFDLDMDITFGELYESAWKRLSIKF